MQRENDDDAWRAIVDNYGDRPDLGDDDGDRAALARLSPERPPAELRGADDATVDPEPSEERYVPPPPPPLPTTTTDRLIAWIGVFGSPTVLLLCLVVGIDLPPLLGYLLVGSFVGGFCYLVFKMPRGPRDPNDNGAQL